MALGSPPPPACGSLPYWHRGPATGRAGRGACRQAARAGWGGPTGRGSPAGSRPPGIVCTVHQNTGHCQFGELRGRHWHRGSPGRMSPNRSPPGPTAGMECSHRLWVRPVGAHTGGSARLHHIIATVAATLTPTPVAWLGWSRRPPLPASGSARARSYQMSLSYLIHQLSTVCPHPLKSCGGSRLYQ